MDHQPYFNLWHFKEISTIMVLGNFIIPILKLNEINMFQNSTK